MSKASDEQIQKAEIFKDLHKRGDPLILYNIWDGGSAQVVMEAGAKALATGSWSVAAAMGYPDGEQLPLDLLLRIAERIVATSDLPVSIDVEGAYASEAEQVAANALLLMQTGAVGCNFEDQVVGANKLYSVSDQTVRIKAIRAAAAEFGLPFFINARTDLFLHEPDQSKHAALLPEAIERANAYQQAGASGFFVPGLVDNDLIAKACERIALPLNIFKMSGVAKNAELAAIGVSRISYGPTPYRQAMRDLKQRFDEME